MKLTVEKVVYGGLGLARIPAAEGARAGKRIFVPFTLPGEQVTADLREETRGHATGNLLQVEEASPLRTAPVCPHFMRCGGCHLQHATAAAQVGIKREVLRETLERAGVRRLPEISILQAGPLHYRNRMRLHVQMRPDFRIGQRGQKTHAIVPLEQCPIVAPVLERCLQSLRTLGAANAVPDGVTEMEFFCNHDASSVLLRAFAAQSDRQLLASCGAFFAALQMQMPELAGAALFLRNADRKAAPEAQALLRWKTQELAYRVGTRTYQVSIASFFQTNRLLLDDFVALVCDGLHGQQAWDLYAGVGLFARVLAENFAHVTAVEASPASIRDLRHNLDGLSATIVPSTTAGFLRRALDQRAVSPDLVVVDPPRAGLGLGTAQLLARCRPQRIVYVSCDPATLSRDLGPLIESGHRLDRLHMVEMFPQTYHQETVAVLAR